MPNTLTALVPDAYTALDVVSRELVGFIPSVTLDANASRAALGQEVRSPVVPAQASRDIVPGTTRPNDGTQTIGNVSLKITKSKAVPFVWEGEESLGLNNGGPGVLTVQQDQIAQAFRTLVNEVEADIGLLAKKASRAYGTAGTTPFASNLGDPAQVRKILTDNGASPSDLQLIIDTSAGAAMRTLANLTRANEAGDVRLLRQGILLDIHNFKIRESAGVYYGAAGTAASATTNTAGYAVGATTITLASAGTGTLLAGDIITFAGDTNKYVIASGDSDVSNGGTFTIAAPGLRKAIAASATAITVVAASTRNLGFARSAIGAAIRQPALPPGGDGAVDRVTIVDPRSGIAFEIAQYGEYRRMAFEVGLAWGVEMIKPEHATVLLG